ncbi:adenosinetriphosphatase [Exophiala viscosa]|uniref:adenosinetriphosphatase n=1 Tax=Exophiala viscosa TaxID=2486360 RepID=UPI00219B535E|nr:adenosinetriphosphatase [Exophiala viscosa]
MAASTSRFVPRQRKHKVRAREQTGSAAPESTNQEQIVPLSKVEREVKRARLREELRAQQPPKISSKKQKRLDKYIENKLKKDETLDLLRKLEQEKEKYEATAGLQESKNLGKRSFGEFVHGKGPSVKTGRHGKKASGSHDESDVDSEDSFEADNPDAFADGEEQKANGNTIDAVGAQGTGLKQPLAVDENGLPVIQIRKNKKRKKIEEQMPQELPWEGFESEPEEDEHSSGLDSEDLESDDSQTESDDEDDSDDSDVEESDMDSATSSTSGGGKPAPRNSAFKAWATAQLNQSVGHVPSYTTGEGELPPKPEHAIPKPQIASTITPGVLPVLPAAQSDRKVHAFHVERPQEIQETRSALPILQREQEIMEAVHNNDVVIVKSDTGSGKTTQLPQFLFEAGYGSPEGPTPGMIGITQPRRVAAVSMAKRVSTELGSFGDKVSYQIRFDSTVSPKTAVKFMTDGILLRELSKDLLLRKYSVIVIDEAHERSVNTDILIGMLSKIVPGRMQKSKFNPNPTPLKLIIMSATLNIDDFLHEKLFPVSLRPPIVEAEGRQHRVTTHFALKSRADYVEEVIEKVRRAHKKLPHGGILVFVTGQNEIREVGRRLGTLLAPRNGHNPALPRVQIAASEAPIEAEDLEIGDPKAISAEDDFDEVDILTHSEDEAADDDFDISDDEEKEGDEPAYVPAKSATSSKQPYNSVHILPLYSQLPTSEQLKVFEPPPVGARMIVLATNVAETSLTIPGIRYVFDTGRSKERKYNLDTGVQGFEIDYISKASAQQRAGRAGRTGPGHCWRLYTSAVYEQYFPDHAEPEILRAPAESVVLQLKGFAYPRPVADFPFPTPPATVTLNKAEKLLKNLGALTNSGSITDLGKQLSVYPLSPRLGKILTAGTTDTDVLWHVLTLVSGLAVPEVFITEAQADLASSQQGGELYTLKDQQADDERDNRRQAFGRARATLSKSDKMSDAMRFFTAVSMYLGASDKEQLCKDLFLRSKAMAEIAQLRSQLESIVRANHREISSDMLVKSKAANLSSGKVKHLNSIAASGYIDQVAIRYDRAPNPPDVPVKPRRAIEVPYLPLVPLHDRASASIVERAVYIHPSSVLARLTVKELPEYISYSHLQRAQAHTVATEAVPKTRMFPLTPLDGAQLVHLARETALIEYGKPVPKTKVEDIPGTPRRRECWVLVELRAAKGLGFGWPLPPMKVRQVVDVKEATGWRVEKVLT